MGMKYIEQVKSVMLLLLVLMSFTLTFSSWTYSPNYETIDTPILDISIAEKKTLEDVIKPYRLLFSENDKFTGSTSTQSIERVLGTMKSWEIQMVELVENEVTVQEINRYINAPNRFTLFFTADVPIKTYSSIFPFADHTLPDASFNRLVVDWSDISKDEILVYFINTADKKVYSSTMNNVNKQFFINSIINQAKNFPVYNEIERNENLSLYVSASPEKTVSYTYYLEEIAPEKFKNALFNTPSIVRSNPFGTTAQEYTDDSALMNVDYSSKRISYVDPAAESEIPVTPEELIQNTVNFVNEHDGWTDDFRYSRINPITQQVNYQLYYLGLPVFSDDTSTEIIEYWGKNRVYRYIRPYYILDVPLKTIDTQLPSGQIAYETISEIPEMDSSTIVDIVAGYYLSRDDNQPILSLEPSWYYLVNGSWIRLAPDLLGGDTFGLE